MSLSNPKINDKQKVATVSQLPVLPSVVKSLLTLKQNPNSGPSELAAVLSADPVLTAHFLKASNTAFFGNTRQIVSLQEAIQRMGYTIVLNIAIGMSANNAFNIPASGPIGIQAIWQHAIYSAHLMRSIASKIPSNTAVNPDLAFLAGLLHHIGFVLLGDQFREEFNLINNNLLNSKKSLGELESVYLGISHCELGAILMRSWGLPNEIIVATFEHHNPHYKGEHHGYANLAYLANYLLQDFPISDTRSSPVPEKLLNHLKLDENVINQEFDHLMDKKDKLDSMLNSLLH